jgi:hypothetical protein
VDGGQTERFLESAEKKLTSAHQILAFDAEARLRQAREAMRKASPGFLFSFGFRQTSLLRQHIAIAEFVWTRIDKKPSDLITGFDRLRRKPNAALTTTPVLYPNRTPSKPCKPPANPGRSPEAAKVRETLSHSCPPGCDRASPHGHAFHDPQRGKINESEERGRLRRIGA